MPSVIKSVSFDAADALVLARFWAAVLGSDVDEDSTVGKAFVEAAGWGGPNIWFTQVPEPKTAKNRVHFDLRAPGPYPDRRARMTRRRSSPVTARAPATPLKTRHCATATAQCHRCRGWGSLGGAPAAPAGNSAAQEPSWRSRKVPARRLGYAR